MNRQCQTFSYSLYYYFPGYNEKIPFVKPAPIDEAEAKKQKKGKKDKQPPAEPKEP